MEKLKLTVKADLSKIKDTFEYEFIIDSIANPDYEMVAKNNCEKSIKELITKSDITSIIKRQSVPIPSIFRVIRYFEQRTIQVDKDWYEETPKGEDVLGYFSTLEKAKQFILEYQENNKHPYQRFKTEELELK